MLQSRIAVRQGLVERRTVVQVMVVFVLVIFSVGIFLPYMYDRGRHSGGARAESAHRIMQLTLSIHNFESYQHGRIPPALGGTPLLGAGVVVDNPDGLSGSYSQSFPTSYLTVHGFLLPFMEQEPLYDAMAVKSKSGEKDVLFVFPTVRQPGSGKPAYQVAIKTYYSSADPSLRAGLAQSLVISKPNSRQPGNNDPMGPPAGATSYAANFKLFGVLTDDQARVVSFDRAIKVNDIPDGASYTIAFAEKYGVCTAPEPIPGVPTNQGIPVPNGQAGSLWAEPNLNENAPFFAYPQGGNSTYTTGPGLKFQVQPNPFDKKCNPYRASTPFVSGILVGMADGSVRKVSPGVSPETWYSAVTPDDGKKLGSDW